MKSKLMLKRVLFLIAVLVFVGLYVTGWVYTGSHSKQGNLWLAIMEVVGVFLAWLGYVGVVRLFLNGPLFRTGLLAALLPALVLTDAGLACFHLWGFLAKTPENQLTLAYGPLLLALTGWTVYGLDRLEKKRQQV